MADSLWIIPWKSGEYAGKCIEDCSTWYLKWLLEQEWFCEKFEDGVKAIEIELAYREDFFEDKEDTDQHWNRRVKK